MLNSNIQKGGALIEDSLRLIEEWDLDAPKSSNLEKIVGQNLLGKTTSGRGADIVRRTLAPRLIEGGPHVLAALKTVASQSRPFREACYYEASRDDALLRRFAEEPLYQWFISGRLRVTVDDVIAWFDDLSRAKVIPAWGESVRRKTARGLLAALRDFGILEGRNEKRFAAPNLSLLGFVYVAYREQESGTSARALLTGKLWRRWLLDDVRVRDLFLAADRLGVLKFYEAGSAVRIDWAVGSIEEAVGAAA